jgi:hypothetical protein
MSLTHICKNHITMKRFLFLSLLFLLTAGALKAQYFGRNKPRYQQHDFKVLPKRRTFSHL